MVPKKSKTAAAAATRSVNSDSDFKPDKTIRTAPAMGKDAQLIAEEDYDADTEEESIYETVHHGRSVNRGKAPIIESSSEDEDEEPDDNEDNADESEEKAEEDGPDDSDGPIRKSKAILKFEAYYTKPRHEIVAEHEAATGHKVAYDDEEGQAKLHLAHLFRRACPLPSLNDKTIRNDHWLEAPRETLAGLQQRAQKEMFIPAISDQEVRDDLADMRTGVQFKAWSSHDEDEGQEDNDQGEAMKNEEEEN